jgi:UPF0755 protein
MNLFFRRKAFLVLGLFFLFFSLSFYGLLFRPPSQTSLTKVIYIRKGMPLKKISAMLEQEGIIRNRHFFVGIATVLGKKAGIKAGEYEFHTQMLPLEVLDILVKGQVKLHLVTIAEGYTLSQIAQLLGELGILDSQAFFQKSSSKDFISTLGLPIEAESTLEGYLFPDTYHLYREMEPEEAIQMMVRQFKKVFNSDLTSRASDLGITPREVVILASIIERETPLSEEKPLISAVFHNRLKKGMPLQSDPTVIYGIKNFDGNLTKEDLLRPTPYNTYLIKGLPPTPICNPGKDSILAALYPASVSYLYFVSKNDGSHYFSSDIGEHNQAVWKYQKNPKKRDL